MQSKLPLRLDWPVDHTARLELYSMKTPDRYAWSLLTRCYAWRQYVGNVQLSKSIGFEKTRRYIHPGLSAFMVSSNATLS